MDVQKFHIKIYERALLRLQQQGLAAAVRYATSVFAGTHNAAAAFIALVQKDGVEPFATVVTAAMGARAQSVAQKAAEKNIQMQKIFAEADRKKQAEHEAYLCQFQSADKAGMAIVYLASIAPAARDKLGTLAQRKQATALRMASVRSTAVKQALGCSDTELKRWSQDGRLPVLFRRRTHAGMVTLDVRYWAPDVVQAALPLLPVWREEDRRRKK